MKLRKAATVIADLESVKVPTAVAKMIAEGAGLQGAKADEWVKKNRAKIPEIEAEQVVDLFDRIYPKYVKDAQDQVEDWTGDPGKWASYPSQMQDVLADLMYHGHLGNDKKAKLSPSLTASSYSQFREAILDFGYWRKHTILKDTADGRPNERFLWRARWLPEDPKRPDVVTFGVTGLPNVKLRTRLSTPFEALPAGMPIHRVIEGVLLVNSEDKSRTIWLPVPPSEGLLPRALRFDFANETHLLRQGFELFIPLLDRTLLSLALRVPEGGPANPVLTLEGALIGPDPATASDPVGGWPAFKMGGSQAVFKDGPVLDLSGSKINVCPLYPGQAEIGLTNAALSVALEEGQSTLRATRRDPASPVSTSVTSSLVYRGRQAGGFSEDIAVPLRVTAPFNALANATAPAGTTSAGAARFLKLEASDADARGTIEILRSPRPPNPGEVSGPLGDWLASVSLSDALPKLKASLQVASLDVPAGEIFSGASSVRFAGLSLAPTTLDAVPVELAGDEIIVGKLGAQIKLSDSSQLDLVGGALRLTRELVVAMDGAAPTIDFELRDSKTLLATDGSPFSIRILKNTRVRLALDPGGPTLFLARDGGCVAEIAVPGVPNAASFDDANLMSTRFVFDVAGHEDIDPSDLPPGTIPRVCRISSGGAEIRADVRARPIAIPLVRNGRVLEGTVAVASGDVYIHAKATADLPYFERATGTMEVAASSAGGLKIGAHFDVDLGKEWTDPSGVLSVRSPSAWVDVKWSGKWDVNGGVGGTLVFRPPAAFGDGAAADWLSKLFSGVEMTFDDLALGDLADVGKLANGLSLKLKLARPISVSLWQILKTTIDDIKLWGGGISIGGDFEASLPGVAKLSGRLPMLGIGLRRGAVHLGLDKDNKDSRGFSMRGQLELATGVRAALSFLRDDVSVSGFGALSIPGLPEMKVLCRLGRTKNGRLLLALYFSVDVPITVFPGIVLRKWGAGVGINETLKGVKEVSRGYSEKVLSGEVAMPNPGAIESWAHNEEDETRTMLVVQTYICPSTLAGKDDSTPQPYLANAVLTLSSDGTVALFTNLWLFTSFNDAEKQDFRSAPLARGIAVLSPRRKRLEARYKTLPRSKMTRDLPILSDALNVVQTEATLIVSPELFRFKLGPTRADLTILGIHFSGQSLLLVEMRRGVLVVGYRVTLAANFSQSIGVSFALVTASVRLSASFAFDAMFVATASWIGGDSGLTLYGRARVDIAASLEIELKIGFRITIKIWRWKKTIEIYKRFSASISLVFKGDIQALIGAKPAFAAKGTIEVKLFGVTLRLSAGVSIGDTDRLGPAYAALKDYLE
ncbi:MAG: hypothetical protein U0441_09175 [Polyangiaceae bacterium]